MTIYRGYGGFGGKRADGTYVNGIIPQFDGSAHASNNCGAASEAMRLVSQQKGARPSKGSPWYPTGASIRRETGDTSGGLNPQQTTQASYNEYGVPHASPRISAFADVVAKLKGRYSVDLLVGYGPINRYKSGSSGFTGNHRGVVTAIDTERRMWLWADPLYDGRRSGIPLGPQWIPQSVMYAAAGALVLNPSTGKTVVDGEAYFVPSLTHMNEPVPYKAQVPKGKFMRYIVKDGVITDRHGYETGGFSATCTPPRAYRWPGHGTYNLVRLTSGSRSGWYINAKYAREV